MRLFSTTSGVEAGRRLRPALLLFAAAALGIGGQGSSLLRLLAGPRGAGVNQVAADADEAYAPLLSRLAPGERIGVLVASGDPGLDLALHYAAQYALAPAVVEPIYLTECLERRRGARCGLDAVDRVAFVARDPTLLWVARGRLGLVEAERVGGVAILEKATP